MIDELYYDDDIDNQEPEFTEEDNSTFKSLVFELNTSDRGLAEIETLEIQGFIEAIIIKTGDEQISPVNIYSEMENEEICILDMKGFSGNIYMPIRTRAYFLHDKDSSEYAVTRYSINGPIGIIVTGAYNRKVKFEIRYITEE